MSCMLCLEGKLLQQISQPETLKNHEKLNNLFRKNISAKSSILIFMGHNIHIPAIVLSLRNCGHCFMPVDSFAKNEEIEELIEEAQIQYILSLNSKNISFKNFVLIDFVVLRTDSILLWKNNVKDIKNDSLINEVSLLCIIPSSGTTGKRKLIKIENYCIDKNVESLRRIFDINQEDVIYFGTPLIFDPSLVELFLSLKTGANLLIVSENTRQNPESLFHTLFPRNSEYFRPTFLQMVPSLFTRWSEKQIKYILNEQHLKVLALGGEPFPIEILQFERSLRLFNLYGITEISCWATIYEIGEDNNVFLGGILEETLIEVHSNGKEIKEGIGELYLGSDTRHCYVNDEMQKVTWRPTGDLVNKTERGITYLGRKNNVLKRLGHQISLEEIEKKVYAKIRLPCKCVWSKIHLKLLLFILIPTIHQEDKMRILDKLRITLLHILHKEEFPDFFDLISKFPITCNGKVDKTTLMQIYQHAKIRTTDQSTSDIFLILLAKFLGQSISSFERIKNYTFFELGGNSILYTLLINNFRDILKCDLPSQFFPLLFGGTIDECIHFLKQVKLTNCTVERTEAIENIGSAGKKRKYSKNGNIIWKHNFQACVDASPLIFKRNESYFVAVGSFSYNFGIFTASSGEPKFIEVFEGSIGSKATISHCSIFIYFGCSDGKLVCINLENYNIEWTYQAGNSIKCTPYFCDSREALVFGSYDKHLHYIYAKTGKLIWKTNIEESIVTTPLVHHSSQQVLVTTLMGSCLSVSEEIGRINWRVELGSPIFSTSSIINDNNIIIADVRGNINSIDVKTGKKMFLLKVKGEIYSSVTLTDNHLIFSSHQGYLYKCKLKHDNFGCDIIGKLHLGDAVSTTPCIFQYFEKTIIAVVTVHGNLCLVNFEDMHIETQWKCPGDVYSSPVFYNNNLYFGCRDDNLYCLSIDSLFDANR